MSVRLVPDFNTTRVRFRERRRARGTHRMAHFNTTRVRFRAIRAPARAPTQWYFNTTRVRFRERRHIALRCREPNFNTTRVRFRAVSLPWGDEEERISIPQGCDSEAFLPIRRPTRRTHFNTTRVRFRALNRRAGIGVGERFQYHKGAIQSCRAVVDKRCCTAISIPQGCDSEACRIPSSCRGLQISIPQGCDSEPTCIIAKIGHRRKQTPVRTRILEHRCRHPLVVQNPPGGDDFL